MGDITKSKSEIGNTEPERTNIKELAELSETPVRDKVTDDNDNENPRNAKEGDMEELRMKLWTNHIIMREIMSHLDWRELLACELVCRLWRDAVKSLQLQLRSYDFVVQVTCSLSKTTVREIPIEAHVSDQPVPELPIEVHVSDQPVPELPIEVHVSDQPVQSQPMCAISFYKGIGCRGYFKLNKFHKDKIIEAVRVNVLSERCSMLLVKDSCVIYMPPSTSRTFQYTTHDDDGLGKEVCFLGGLYLPKIPNVNYHYDSLQLKCKEEHVYNIIDDICATDIVKGVLLFVDNQCGSFNSKRLVFLNYFKSKQPSIPFALGGCYLRSGGERMCVFSVPREPKPVSGSRCHFNMYSLIIDSTVREKAAIQKVIQTFAENVSKLQFSAALLLLGSAERAYQKELFRDSFPRTTILGRYCGKTIVDGEQGFVQSETTVFVYFTWGKQLTSSGEEEHHSKQ